MRATVRDWLEHAALDRGDVLAVAVALCGCVVATVVALRVPLFAGAGPGDTGVLDGTADAAAPVDAAGAPTDVQLLVHVAGAVVTPGVVELPVGARVADAIAAAGGALPDAELGTVNLARVVTDGEQVVVPSASQGAAGTGDPDGGEGAPDAVPADPVRLPDGRLDLNTATAADLEELPGVGPVLAARIVAHRDEHGPFTQPAQLLDVSGIGEATWASLRDLVGVR